MQSRQHHIATRAANTTASGIPRLQLSGPLQGKTLSFPHLGSGLLFARSTGLKLWPGAQLLANYMVQISADVVTHDRSQSAAVKILSPAAPSAADGAADRSIPTAARAGTQLTAASSTPHSYHWQDQRVLELGCGLGLCSTVAALLGAQATATDGDADVVNVAKRNARANVPSGGTRHPLVAAQLRWGDAAALSRLGFGGGAEADVVLLSDVVYGSDPGVWEALVATLSAAAGQHTLVLQAETPRVETPDDYAGYWDGLVAAGFTWAQLPRTAVWQHADDGSGGKLRTGSGAVCARLWALRKAGVSTA